MRTYIITHASIVITAAVLGFLTSGCSGSEPGPVMSYELDGSWCTLGPQPRICLTVIEGQHYVWQVGLCFERGDLTGGLEFWPDTDSRLCVAPEYGLYSAAGEWTASGLRLTVDTLPGEERATMQDPGRVLELHY